MSLVVSAWETGGREKVAEKKKDALLRASEMKVRRCDNGRRINFLVDA